MALADLRGTMGNQVMVGTRGGLALRRKAQYRYVPVGRAADQAARFKSVSALWSELSYDAVQAWRAYADTVLLTDRISGSRYSPTAFNAFVGLATKFVQVNPGEPVPLLPPVGEFLGDSVQVSTSVVGSAVRFSATGANADGVVTELMLQPLANVRRKPNSGAYKAMAFVAFASGSLSADVGVEPGVYACAYRFVEAATGRMGLLMPLDGIVVVE